MPELNKMAAAKADTQPVGEFLDWCESQGIFLASHSNPDYPSRPFPLTASIESLLARWQGIDLAAAEQEKLRILQQLR